MSKMPAKIPTKIKKRDGRVVSFKLPKITTAVFKAGRATGEFGKREAARLSDLVVDEIVDSGFNGDLIAVEQVQDMVEEILMREGHFKTAKAYVLYRELHRRARDLDALVDVNKLIGGYLDRLDWRVRENANMTYSLQGLNIHVSTAVSSKYWLNQLYGPEAKEAHESGDLHIHDLYLLAPYCCGWELRDFLLRGFGGVPGKIESKPPKHFKVALGQLVNFLYTLQGEAAGAEAVSNFDTLLAPFIRYDNLDYREVRQSMQEFLFNINVPTRVGFQCVSEDTEILTPKGWRRYGEVKRGSAIKTYNLESGEIENQKVKSVFRKKYKGEMYRLQNRIQDQLISPGHRVVRRKFNSDRVVLEPIEQVVKLKSPFIVPIAGENKNKNAGISDEQIKLMAWIISEGTIERPTKYRCCYRVSIYQSKIKNRKNYDEIVRLLKHFKLEYSTYKSASLGEDVDRLRLNAESSRKIHRWFGTRENVHFIPSHLLNMSERQSRLFLETYLKADGSEGHKISTTELELVDSLQIIIVNSGYGFTVLKRRPTIGKKDIYVLRIIRHKETYISRVEKVNYEGVIWCPNTKNGTIIARRNGKVFITGNTPFTNVTLDLKVPDYMSDEPVIIGGKPQNKTYSDFQKEMDMFNKAFAEVMLEGDAKGRVFTFPIPTYNVTPDLFENNGNLDAVWEMTAKYGIPYFANFINSEMKPEDARSMCCRLRLDNRELRKRGGGYFGASPLTGSIGVVTINLPRIGHLSKSKEEFFERLEDLMGIARRSLIAKRKVLEKFTEGGLYPYSRVLLSGIKKGFGRYWYNHFSTIGIIGGNEACLNFLGKDIATPEGQKFMVGVLDFMNERLRDFQAEDDQMYNLEATPAEGTSYRLAKMDKEKYPEIAVPYYTNSTQLSVDLTENVFEALDLQDELQCKYTGGTVFHSFLGERLPNGEAVKNLVRKIAENYRLPYFTLTPTFSICMEHGYIAGEHPKCPQCGKECEVYSRVVGYLRPVNQWNAGKQVEFEERKEFRVG